MGLPALFRGTTALGFCYFWYLLEWITLTSLYMECMETCKIRAFRWLRYSAALESRYAGLRLLILVTCLQISTPKNSAGYLYSHLRIWIGTNCHGIGLAQYTGKKLLWNTMLIGTLNLKNPKTSNGRVAQDWRRVSAARNPKEGHHKTNYARAIRGTM